MEIREVTDSKLARIFVNMPVELYKGDPNWIRPLDKDIDFTFDRDKNKLFQKGDARRWLLFDGKKCIGRVAAFYKNESSERRPYAGMGFFECINDKKAAFMLFDECKKFLESKGFQGMDGPVNFGERDRFWGLMVDGFTPPVYGMLYTHKYYKALFEDYGFKTYFEQYYFYLPFKTKIPEKFEAKARRVAEDPLYSASHVDLKQMDFYTEAFRTVYNDSWAKYPGMKPMTEKQAKGIMKSLKPIMDPNIIWFVFYDKKPVAFFVMIPDYNSIFAKFNGKLNLWNKLRFLYFQKIIKIRKVFGLIFGVHPDHQGKGVEGYLIKKTGDHIQHLKHYDDLEMTWIGDFNPKMLKVVEGLGATRCRTFITYRKLFDPNAPFERMPKV